MNADLGRAAITLLGLLLAPQLIAQSKQEEQRPMAEGVVVSESIDVREIHLDAVVTDRDREPVLDLESSDFDLRVDGKKVKVTGVSRGVELRETLEGRLTIVVFIDERHLVREHRNSALREIERALIEEMEANPTWVAVTTFSDSLRPLLSPTRDVDALRRALREATEAEIAPNEIDSLRQQLSLEVRDTLRQLSEAGSAYRFGQANLSSLTAKAETYAATLAEDNRVTLTGSLSLVEALAFVPGRKAVLMVSDGLPSQPLDLLSKTMFDRLAGGSRHYSGDDISAPATSGLNDSNNRPSGSDRMDSTGQGTVNQEGDGGASAFQRAMTRFSSAAELAYLSAVANTHRVTFYPMKPPVQNAQLAGAGGSSASRGSVTALSDPTTGLQALADETGGLALTSAGDLGGFLREVRDDASSYYSVSFAPPESMPDSTGIRQMELKVRRKKTHIRHRASYVPLTLEQSLASRAWGTLVFDWQENSLGLEIDSSQRRLDDALYEVQIAITLPIGSLELIENGPNHAGVYRATLQIRDAEGNRLDPHHLGFVVQIPSADLEAARSQYFAVTTPLKMVAGRYDLVVGLWEENSATMSFATMELVVGRVDQDEV